MNSSLHKPYIHTLVVSLLVLLVISVVLLMASIWYISLQDEKDKRYIHYTDALKVSTQTMREEASNLLQGNFSHEDALRHARMIFVKNYRDLFSYYQSMSIAEPPITRFPEALQLFRVWEKTSASVDAILTHQVELVNLYHTAQKAQSVLQTSKKNYKHLVYLLLKKGAPDDHILAANQQAWLLENMLRFIDHELHGNAAEDLKHPVKDSPRIFYQHLNDALNASHDVLLVHEESELSLLVDIKARFDVNKQAIDQTFNSTDTLSQFYRWTQNIIDDSYQTFAAIDQLQTAFNADAAKRRINVQTSTWLGLVAVAIILMLAGLLIRYTRQQLKESKAKHRSDQRSVAQLTDCLIQVGQGDLTIVAPVMTDITQNIAQAINISTGHLRNLVTTIARAAGKVESCAAGSQLIAEDLKKNTWHQIRYMQATSDTIATMIRSINQVFDEAHQAKEVAEETVQTASFGNTIVKNSVHSMEHIGQQIQSTSEQIKKLSESSQEVSQLMTVIHDLAEKTHVIALNATVQAKGNPDSEQGLAQVADEVGHLADQSFAATDQVEQWVKRLQQDTQSAMIAMAGTISEAAKGVQLARQAGDALDSIETISHDLAHMIEEIARITSGQSQSVEHLSATLSDLQTSTQDVNRVTQNNTASIDRLHRMSGMMKQTVADFTLPSADAQNVSK